MSTESSAAPVDPATESPAEPPSAKQVPHQRTFHGDTVTDEYAWLADKSDPDTIAYLTAENAYTGAATAGLAARLDFTLDDIEDLRIAVDEACAMLLSQAVPGSNLECGFTLSQDTMTIAVSVPCLDPEQPASDTFAWTVLTALAGSVDASVGPDDVLTIVLRKTRESSGSV